MLHRRVTSPCLKLLKPAAELGTLARVFDNLKVDHLEAIRSAETRPLRVEPPWRGPKHLLMSMGAVEAKNP